MVTTAGGPQVTTPAEAAVRTLAERDGDDGCPPWAVQCAHWDGQLVWISDRGLFPAEFWEGHIGLGQRYAVTSGAVHNCNCGHHVKLNIRHLSTDSLAEARDEFELRERKLLGHEEA